MGERISLEVRERVAAAAHYRCSYCQTAERVVGPFFEIDHIVPESLGGTNDETNLVFACARCNRHKSNRQEALDPETGEVVPLFNPRRQRWHDHFDWTKVASVVRGRTPIGRATVAALNLNGPKLVLARRLWVAVGWHPPTDD